MATRWVCWAYLVSVIDCCTREIVGWDLSLRCRTQEAIAAVERAVLETMATGPRGCGLVLNTDNSTQFTSTRFVETLTRLNEYRSLDEAKESIGCWIEEYNHDRPHRALNNRTPREAHFLRGG